MASKREIERPVVGFVLSLIGGLFIVAGSIYGLILSASVSYGYPGGFPGSYYVAFGVLGIVIGVGVLVGSALVYLVPRQRVAWGIVILVLGVASLFDLSGGFYGGFFIGMILAIVGGALSIAWRPSGGLQLEDYRTCLACGRHIPAEYPVCPYCGTPVATVLSNVRMPPPP